MKKALLLLMFVTFVGYSQEYELGDKSITKVFEVPEKTQGELFSLLNKWVSLNYVSAQDVIQMSDESSGTIIVKGINSVTIKNPSKALYPKNDYIPATTTYNFNHTLEINTKDNKYRVIYTITDIITPNVNTVAAGFNLSEIYDMYYDTISFSGNNAAALEKFIAYNNEFMEKSRIKEKKREKLIQMAIESINELNTSLTSNVKQTVASLNESVVSNANDEW